VAGRQTVDVDGSVLGAVAMLGFVGTGLADRSVRAWAMVRPRSDSGKRSSMARSSSALTLGPLLWMARASLRPTASSLIVSAKSAMSWYQT
jgi:hypothetical protein